MGEFEHARKSVGPSREAKQAQKSLVLVEGVHAKKASLKYSESRRQP